MDPYTAQGNEESVRDVLARYETKGFTGSFRSRPGTMVQCLECHDESVADQVPLKALHRFEGASNPDDECALAALECPSCGEWGTLMLAYGPEASAEDAEVMSHLLDDREHSVVVPGL